MYSKFNPYRFAWFLVLFLVCAFIAVFFTQCNTIKRAEKIHDKERKRAEKGKDDRLKEHCAVWYPFAKIYPVRVYKHDTTYTVIPGKDSIAYVEVDCDTVKVNHIVRVPYKVCDTVDRIVTVTQSVPYVDSVAIYDLKSKLALQDKQLANMRISGRIWRLSLFLIGLVIGFIAHYLITKRA